MIALRRLLVLTVLFALPGPVSAGDPPDLTDRERIAGWVISNTIGMKEGEKPLDAVVSKFRRVVGVDWPQLDYDSRRIPVGKGAFEGELRWSCRIRFYTPLQAKEHTQEAHKQKTKADWCARDERTGADVFIELKPASQQGVITFLRVRQGIYVRVIVRLSIGPNPEVKQLVEQASKRWQFFYEQAEERQLYLPAPDRFSARDVNPALTGVAIRSLESVPPERLAELGPDRERIAADGVSRLLLVAKFERPGKVVFSIDGNDGEIRPVYRQNPHRTRKVGRDTDEDGDPDADIEYMAFAVYAAPVHFGERVTGRVTGTKMHYRDVVVRYRFTPEEGAPLDDRENLELVRPPVLLVHGTFDTPNECWRTTSPESSYSFADALGRAGFHVSLVDYTAKNTAGFGPGSFFEHGNSRTLMDATGGIRDTLDYCRDQLDLAVTQVDVVGHSLGGLIARIWASTRYNPDYRRDENFNEGDIHRLITIGTPHHGSDLGKILKWLGAVNLAEHGVAATTAASTFTTYASWIDGASAEEGAVHDQLPRTEALENVGTPTALTKIGKTAIPAHAVVCVTEPYGYIEGEGPRVDPDEEYLSSLQWTGLLFFKNPILLEEFFRDDGMEDEGYFIVDLLETQHRYFMEEEGVRERFANLGAKGPETHEIEPREVLEYFRMAMFGHDENDMTVRAESQRGGLPESDPRATTRIGGPQTTNGRGVLHGRAPRYRAVQDAVIRVLTEDCFHRPGFPAAGVQMNYREPLNRPDPHGLTRDEKILWSGMVKEHAEAYAAVVTKERAVVLGRPVNPDSTPLIADSAATKDMSIKGKSSTWGPHKGCVPVEQRYSKIWRTKAKVPKEREEDIEHYGNEVRELLAKPNGPAKPVELKVNAGGTDYDVMILTGEQWEARAEDAVVLRDRESGEIFDWRNSADGSDYTRERPAARPRPEVKGKPMRRMEVLADSKTGQVLTADYDALAIGFQEDDPRARQSHSSDMQPNVGKVTMGQTLLIFALNRGVQSTGYRGGNVIHHGPETNYFYRKNGKWDGSPYVDYPIIAFEPANREKGETVGRIRLILEGPPGYRDMHLKRYFAKMRRRPPHYVLMPNPRAPGWQWKYNEELRRWEDADTPGLPEDVDQIPRPGPGSRLVHQAR